MTRPVTPDTDEALDASAPYQLSDDCCPTCGGDLWLLVLPEGFIRRAVVDFGPNEWELVLCVDECFECHTTAANAPQRRS